MFKDNCFEQLGNHLPIKKNSPLIKLCGTYSMFMNELFECFSKHCIRNAWFRSYSRQNLFREIDTFLKNFVKLTFSAKKLVLYSTVCKSTIKCDDAQKFREINSLVTYLTSLVEMLI